ncbi:hypothetical protein PAEVO_44310 [Paenibacillus sp. GM2FR]|uniref:transposase n=1 Tax=Paenibacillus sp. GM2FR TaxID=2059268 RepID=UPI000CAAF7B3|nr:transposase [Paenibacillus sp. GM2FR]PJN51339.1 hypothetical protein PAEVO_44310 [Paenibacillus sp. GM2FR]
MTCLPLFIRGIQGYFPQAEITFDKLHIMKLVNEAVDDVRIQEQKQAPELKHTKYIWLKNESNLKSEQKDTLTRLKDSDLQTGRAYRLKLAMQDFWLNTKSKSSCMSVTANAQYPVVDGRSYPTLVIEQGESRFSLDDALTI